MFVWRITTFWIIQRTFSCSFISKPNLIRFTGFSCNFCALKNRKKTTKRRCWLGKLRVRYITEWKWPFNCGKFEIFIPVTWPFLYCSGCRWVDSNMVIKIVIIPTTTRTPAIHSIRRECAPSTVKCSTESIAGATVMQTNLFIRYFTEKINEKFSRLAGNKIGTVFITSLIILLVILFFINGCIWACIFQCRRSFCGGRDRDEEMFDIGSMRSSMRRSMRRSADPIS